MLNFYIDDDVVVAYFCMLLASCVCMLGYYFIGEVPLEGVCAGTGKLSLILFIFCTFAGMGQFSAAFLGIAGYSFWFVPTSLAYFGGIGTPIPFFIYAKSIGWEDAIFNCLFVW